MEYLVVLFGGLDVAGEDDLVLAGRKEELKAIVDTLCGEVLRVVPLCLSEKDSKDCYRDPKYCKLERDKFSPGLLGGHFDYLHELGVKGGKIGAHAQVNAGLSGAFSFFLMCEDYVIKRWIVQTGVTYKTKITKPARLEGTMNDPAANQCLAMLNKAMKRCIPHLTFEFRHTNLRHHQKLLFTLPKLSYPNSHSDGKSGKDEGHANECRILWDLHPRGRILSVYTHKYGVFLENCGVEFCSQIMCGRKAMPGNHRNITASKLQHQGWDDCPDRSVGCPMVTVLFDLEIVNSGDHQTNDLVDSVITAINSNAFKNELSKEMKDYVISRMKILKDGRTSLTFDQVRTMQRKQNYEIVKHWWKSFYPAVAIHPYTDNDCFLDNITDTYLEQIYNHLDA